VSGGSPLSQRPKHAPPGILLCVGPGSRGVTSPDPDSGVCWQAPEVIRHAKGSKSSDIYAFGIVLWELATRQEVGRASSHMHVSHSSRCGHESTTTPSRVTCFTGLRSKGMIPFSPACVWRLVVMTVALRALAP
jgi:serine/threonine protein kinase